MRSHGLEKTIAVPKESTRRVKSALIQSVSLAPVDHYTGKYLTE